MKLLKNLLLCAGFLLGAPAFAQNIDTTSSWNGSTFISSFGVTNTATYGQTVTVATPTQLLGFTFNIGNCSAPVTFRGHVYAWNGSMATGASLYDGPTQTVPADSAYHTVSFAPPAHIALAAGQYVLFASTSEDQASATPASCRWGALTNNTTYAGGQFVFINNGPAPGQWTTVNWSNIAEDLAFTANFTATAATAPALSQWSLMTLCLLLLGAGFITVRRSRVR